MVLSSSPIRIVIVDDSAYLRLALRRGIERHPGIKVVGEARDGIEALEVIERTNPDVVTLDVEMPRLDGLATLQRLMAKHPRPVIMVSSLTTVGAMVTMRALELGAVDFVPKPDLRAGVGLDETTEALIAKIQIATHARLRSHLPLPSPTATSTSPSRSTIAPAASAPLGLPPGGSRFKTTSRKLVVIGCSTGGPRALAELVPRLDPSLPVSYVIVQHMPAGFTRSLAERLDQMTAIHVREATQDDPLAIGNALVAPGDWHLIVGPQSVALSHAPRIHGVRPAIDVTLQTAVTAFGRRLVVAILTGMGTDGADGAAAVRAAGGHVIAEDPSTCIVDGMPRAVRERGLAEMVAPIGHIAEAIRRMVREE